MLIRRGFPLMPMVAGGVAAGVLAFAVAGAPDAPAAASIGTGRTVPGIEADPDREPVATAADLTTTTTAEAETSLPPEDAPDREVPTTTPTTLAQRPVVVQAVGDVNFDPTYITNFVEHGYEFAFEGIEDLFHDDDLTVINLECPPTETGVAVDKAFSFACDPEAMPVAAAHGVDVASLANNHGQDRGVEGMLDSLVTLRAAGIAPVGVGADLHEAMRPALFRLGGRTVAVLGMGGVVPGDGWLAADDRPGMASGDDVEQMVDAVEAAAAQADIVVVTIHWGRELVSEPDPADRRRAEAMIAAGADMIFGHHPHRLGELEMIDGAPVYWTLGNFIWPRLSDAGATTGVARVTVDPDGGLTACLLPAFIEESGRPAVRGEPECEAA